MFDRSKTAVIDQVGTNVIFRGNVPLVQNADNSYTFVYDELNASLAGYDLRDYDLVVVSTLPATSEWLAGEMAAFGLSSSDVTGNTNLDQQLGTRVDDHPARLVWWPVTGLPFGIDPATRWSSTTGFDGLISWIVKVSGAQGARPLAIYLHDLDGLQVAGAMHLGWLMLATGISWTRAQVAALERINPLPTLDHLRLIQAYARFLSLYP